MCNVTAELRWWRGRLKLQRKMPRKQRKMTHPQVNQIWYYIHPCLISIDSDSSSSDSSSDSDSDSSSSSSDDQEDGDEKKKKKKKEWPPEYLCCMPIHVQTAVKNLTLQINVSEGVWTSLWLRLRMRTFLLWCQSPKRTETQSFVLLIRFLNEEMLHWCFSFSVSFNIRPQSMCFICCIRWLAFCSYVAWMRLHCRRSRKSILKVH